jgi:multicomponent Na+:H+ antiporter subunit A
VLYAVLAGFAGAGIAPLAYRVLGRACGWILAIIPFAITLYLASFLPAVSAGEVFRSSRAWVPSLGIALSFELDGLALLVALAVSGIGALVVVYAGGYLAGDSRLGRLYALLLAFMASMLGLVLSANLILLFVFWELTSITSYLLIGYKHESEKARKAALQALLVTATGGLALLAGLLMLGIAGDSLDIAVLVARRDLIAAHPLYPAIILMVVAGAFTKSAQMPLHFWLPSAMEAPTPVSAYLHSATMVKAGVFLLARLAPVLSSTALWQDLLVGFGTLTMVVAAFLATQQTDLKRVLAYTTVSALGTLTMLIGIGTPAALKAAIVLFGAHAFYKAALFMVAGIVDHKTGTRDILRLSGLRRALPLTTVGAGLAALSAGGLVPFSGFLAKETTYAALLEFPWLLVASVLANAFAMLVAIVVGWRIFTGERQVIPDDPGPVPVSLWQGPLILGVAGLLLGVFGWMGEGIVAQAAGDMAGQPVPVKLALWQGFEFEALVALGLSVFTLLLGVAFYRVHGLLLRLAQQLDWLYQRGPYRLFDLGLVGFMGLAKWQTRVLQHGYLRYYVLTVVLMLLPAGVLLGWPGSPVAALEMSDVGLFEGALVLVVLLSTGFVLTTGSRMAAVAGLGAVGYGVALLYLSYGAPDLALTQFAIETLSVVVFVLVLYRLPEFRILTTRAERARDAVIAVSAGTVMTLFVLAAQAQSGASRVSGFFAEQSVPAAMGRNVVNVILVDFRSLDTLGEVVVLVVAALGVHALLKLRTRTETP